MTRRSAPSKGGRRERAWHVGRTSGPTVQHPEDGEVVGEGVRGLRGVGGLYSKCNGKPLQEAELVNSVTGLKIFEGSFRLLRGEQILLANNEANAH